jgi:hypothetical protein
VDEKDELSQPIPKVGWPRVQFDGCVPWAANRLEAAKVCRCEASSFAAVTVGGVSSPRAHRERVRVPAYLKDRLLELRCRQAGSAEQRRAANDPDGDTVTQYQVSWNGVEQELPSSGGLSAAPVTVKFDQTPHSSPSFARTYNVSTPAPLR